MADLDSERLLRTLDQLPLPLLVLHAPAGATGALVVACASARGRAFFGAALLAGCPLAEAWPALPAATLAALREVWETGRPAELTAPLPADAGADGRPGPPRSFRVEPSRNLYGAVESLLLTGLEAAPTAPSAFPVHFPTPPSGASAADAAAWPFISYVSSADGRRTQYLSPQWLAYTGQDAAAADLATAWAEAVHPDDLAGLFFTFRPALDARQPWSSELRLRRHDGEYRWFLTQATPALDADGRVRSWWGVSLDVHEQHAASERLRRRESQTRRLLGTIPQLVWTADAHGGLTWVSEQWTTYTGLVLAQSAGSGWTNALHPDDRRTTSDYWTATVVAGTDAEVQFRLREGATGRHRWFVMRAQAQHDELGRPTGWFGTATDVHELHEAREQLQAKDQLLGQVLGRAPAYVATLAGPEHRFTFFNPRFAAVMNHRARVGATVVECVPEVVEQGFIALLDHVYNTGEGYLSTEARLTLRDPGTQTARTIYLDLNYEALRDLQGRVNGILSFGVDVSHRVLAREQAEALQAQVQAADAQLRYLTESLPLITFTTDATGATTYISSQWYAYTGLTPGGPWADVDVAWPEVLHPDDRAASATEIAASIREGKLGRIELRLRGADGRYRWFLTEAVPELAPDGRLRRRHGYMLDIDDLRRAHEQLQAKDQLLSQILGQAPAIIATMTGPEHRFTFSNAAYDELVGQRVRLGRPVAECLPEMVGQGLTALLDGVYRTGEAHLSHEKPVELRDRAGELRQRYLDFTYQPLRNIQGQTTGILAFVVDVTAPVLARQQAEALRAALRAQDERLRTMTEALPQITYIATSQAAVEYVSPQWFAYTGQAPSTAVDGSWATFVHPDDLPRVQRELARHVARATPWRHEFRLRRHDGTYRWHLSQGVPEPTPAPGGRPARWYGSDTDIHELRELEQTLRGSEEQFRFLAESLPQMVWTSTGLGGNDYINQRWFDYTGLDPAVEGDRSNWLAVIHPDDLAPATARWAHCAATGEFFEIEYRFRRHDGQYRWFLGQGRAQRHPDGAILRWFGTCTDIEDQRRAREQLEAQNEELRRTNHDLDQFVYTASHDLRQPINNMAGIFEELTRTAYFRDPDAVLLIDMFEKALRQIDDTIGDLTAIVQVQRRQQPVPTQVVSLEPLAQEIISSLQSQLNALDARVELDFRACPAVPFVRAQLQSVLFNLLSNALKYAVPGRPPLVRIRTTLDPADQHPILTVQDNGLGIDLARHGGQLFQLFSRFHPQVEGSGMGLYLVNRIVESRGGRIEVSSHVGEGTRFTIHLPAEGGG